MYSATEIGEKKDNLVYIILPDRKKIVTNFV